MNKRRVSRSHLEEFFHSTFHHNDQEWTALLINLSPLGAGFLIHQKKPQGLKVGDKLKFSVETPSGDSSFVGEVKWINSVTVGLCFGIEFVELAGDDPLLEYATEPP